MMFACQKKSKSKKFKALYQKLSRLADNDDTIRALLDEYFRLCVTVYCIKAAIHHSWRREYKIEHIMELFRHDEGFARQQACVAQGLKDIFKDTNPLEPVLGEVYVKDKQGSRRLTRRGTKLVAASPEQLEALPTKKNGYEMAGDVLPKYTELTEDFIGLVSRYRILNSADFQS